MPDAPDKFSSIATFTGRLAFHPVKFLAVVAEEIAISAPARVLDVSDEVDAIEEALDGARGCPYPSSSSWEPPGRWQAAPTVMGRPTLGSAALTFRMLPKELLIRPPSAGNTCESPLCVAARSAGTVNRRRNRGATPLNEGRLLPVVHRAVMFARLTLNPCRVPT